jgi:uncharacterized protein (DUF952 family)
MRRLYHLLTPTDWQAADDVYRAASLATEGFIHCSYGHQVVRVANLFYREAPTLLVLCIDPARLKSEVRDEDPGSGESFPHVYGPIERLAVLEVRTLERDAAGGWTFRE